MKVLYLCSSQFSGTTLTSFLLNCHSSIATIGHTMGWHYPPGEEFRCSCGSRIEDCRLFAKVRDAYAEHHLVFDPRDFRTAFKFSESRRLNQFLTGPLPLLSSSQLERFRDRCVNALPKFKKMFAQQQLANYVLISTVLNELDATVYLDNSHSPFRLRALAKNEAMDLYPVHLIRDPRGVSLSLMTNSGLRVADAIKSWIKHQVNIFRIARECRTPLLLSYESLCRETGTELEKIHRFVGIAAERFRGDFKEREHHILGNRMRLSDGKIRLDERWRNDLSQSEISVIERELRKFLANNGSHPLTPVIVAYLDDQPHRIRNTGLTP